MLKFLNKNLNILDQVTHNGQVDKRHDIRQPLNKVLCLLDQNNNSIQAQSMNISSNGLLIKASIEQISLLSPYELIALQSSWLVGIGKIKHIEHFDDGYYFGIELAKAKFKESILVDIYL